MGKPAPAMRAPAFALTADCLHWRQRGACALGDGCRFFHSVRLRGDLVDLGDAHRRRVHGKGWHTRGKRNTCRGKKRIGETRSQTLEILVLLWESALKSKITFPMCVCQGAVFRRFLVDCFGARLALGSGVLDVAGGGAGGGLAFQLLNYSGVTTMLQHNTKKFF